MTTDKAVAKVIWATGYHRLAAQYRVEPQQRNTIVAIVAKRIAEVAGYEKAGRFIELAAQVR